MNAYPKITKPDGIPWVAVAIDNHTWLILSMEGEANPRPFSLFLPEGHRRSLVDYLRGLSTDAYDYIAHMPIPIAAYREMLADTIAELEVIGATTFKLRWLSEIHIMEVGVCA